MPIQGDTNRLPVNASRERRRRFFDSFSVPGSGSPLDSAVDDEVDFLFSKSSFTVDLTGTNIVINPTADDTGIIQIGTNTLSSDIKIFLGGTNKYVEFNRGDSDINLVDIAIDSNAAATFNSLIVTTSANSATLNVSGLATVNAVEVSTTANAATLNISSVINLADAVNITATTANGTQIGTATDQKWGFFAATPIVQPAAAGQAAITNNTAGSQDGTLATCGNTAAADQSGVINDNFTDLYTLLIEIRTALVNLGLIKGAA